MDRYYDENGYIHYDGYIFADDEDDYLQYLESEDSYLRSIQGEQDDGYGYGYSSVSSYQEKREAFKSLETWNEYIRKEYRTQEAYDNDRFVSFWLGISPERANELTDAQLIEFCKNSLNSLDKLQVENFFEEEYPKLLRTEKKELFYKWIFEGKLPPQGERELPF